MQLKSGTVGMHTAAALSQAERIAGELEQQLEGFKGGARSGGEGRH